MHDLVIGIPSYKRPGMLKKLIKSVFASNIDNNIIKSVNIVVVDNDVNKTAKKTVLDLQESNTSFFGLHYYNCPNKGLSNVRNKILSKAMAFNPQYLIFVDDDEYVSPEWLKEFLKTILNNKGNIAFGPVIPKFKKKATKAISVWFGNKPLKDQQQTNFIYGAGNLMLQVAFLKKHNLTFDKRFNTTGAEDTFFGIQAVKKGARIFWSANAIVYETIPKNRATLNWLLKRAYSGATTYTRILFLEKKYVLIFKKLVFNFIYLFIGLLTFILVPFKFEHRYFGPLKLAESMGGFAGLFNLKYHEYSIEELSKKA